VALPLPFTVIGMREHGRGVCVCVCVCVGGGWRGFKGGSNQMKAEENSRIC
jgi:hypothetical protein